MTKFLKLLGIEIQENIKTFNNVFLVKLKAKNLPFSSFGKGFSLEEAKKSAYGEMCERILTKNYFEEYYINGLYKDAIVTKDFLNKELKSFYEIDKLTKEELIDFNSDIFEILSIPFSDIEGRLTYFPINLIQNLYASNGMAFHSSLDKAYYNAKTEIIERFVKFKVIKYALPLPKISHPFNTKNIQIYDATLDGKYPVMAASYIKDNRVILSFGCDLNQEEAIKKAYLELMQTELKNTGRFIQDIDEIRSTQNIQKHFVNLSGNLHTNFLKKPYFKEAKWNFKDLNVFKEKEYFKIYKKNNFYAIHLIIPKISEVYPIEDLIYNNINFPKFDRDYILNFEKYPKEEVFDLLDAIFTYDVGKYVGVLFEKEYTPDEYKQLILKKQKPKFSQKYLNLLNLSKALNEI